MRLEFIDKVKENDVLGKSILTNDGGILLRAGMQLTNQYIKKLKQLGVFYVYVEDERLYDVMVEDERLSELKQETMKNLSRVMRNLSANGKRMKESLCVVEDLINYLTESGDVNKSLYDIKTYDNYTYVHSIDTCVMSTFLGMPLGFKSDRLKELGKGAILHDLGKLRISSQIINKKGTLSDEEYLEVKKHPIYGEELLKKDYKVSDTILRTVLQHHERVDGKGYPHGLEGNQISKEAKIVGICDVYDAVSNDRCYRTKFSPNDAYELILAGSGSLFDENMVIKFKETFSVYPLGCCLKLSNGIEGYVIRQNENFPDRPVLRVLYDSATKKPVPYFEINLLDYSNVVVDAVV